MSRLHWRSERGSVSLIELLMAMVIFTAVLTATLSVFETFLKTNRAAADRNDAQETARSALDRLARDLRNLASPTPSLPDAIDRAQPTDLIFKTVDTNGPNAGQNVVNVERVRYCLDTSAPSNAKLYAQVQQWTSATPPPMPISATDTACPGTQWTTSAANETRSQRVIAEHLTNAYNGQARPVFTYNAAALSDITTLHAELDVDTDVTRGPKETTLSTGVFLRNQNRRPVASFTYSVSGGTIVLNGSGSSDPEGQPLEYDWFDGTTPIGNGPTLSYAVTPGTTHTIKLQVLDPAALSDQMTISGIQG
jgi:type II secretory pathway pseudopilin PulG